MAKKTHCSKKENKSYLFSKKSSFFLSSIVLALLPKCPFCIMAYSSTALLCSAKNGISESTQTNSSSLTILITLFFCLTTFLSIYLIKRKSKEKSDLFFTLVGISIIMYSVSYSGGSYLYYLGIAFVFYSIWGKTNFYQFINRINRKKGNLKNEII